MACSVFECSGLNQTEQLRKAFFALHARCFDAFFKLAKMRFHAADGARRIACFDAFYDRRVFIVFARRVSRGSYTPTISEHRDTSSLR